MAEIIIARAPGTWVVRGGGAVVAESQNAVAVAEPNFSDVIYFPREDVGMAFLEPSATRTTCPHKGAAIYFHLTTPEGIVEDAAWSYETPEAAAEQIAGLIAFDRAKVSVEEI